MKAKKTWILIADGARAQVMCNDGPGKGLSPAFDYDFAASHAKTQAYGSDRPGRGFESVDGSRHAKQPRIDWHTFSKERFAHDMAKVINDAALNRDFDQLVLVAPAKTLGSLRKELSPRTRDMVCGDLAKDLTHATAPELVQHLSGVIVL